MGCAQRWRLPVLSNWTCISLSLIDLSILTGWKLTDRRFYSLVLKDFQFPAKECDDPGPLSLSWLMPRSSRSFPWYLLFCTNILGFVILLHSCLVAAWISLFTSIEFVVINFIFLTICIFFWWCMMNHWILGFGVLCRGYVNCCRWDEAFHFYRFRDFHVLDLIVLGYMINHWNLGSGVLCGW